MHNVPAVRDKNKSSLRTGFTTGACATAAAAAACRALLGGDCAGRVSIRLPNGQTASFALEELTVSEDGSRAAVRKDAGDDPDVTHNALIEVTVRPLPAGAGIVFRAGAGVGTVTRPGLPVAVGEPAINPVPRQMIRDALTGVAEEFNSNADFEVTVSVPGGEAMAQHTWNPRLGIMGGISILGTTGIVRPYSCAAWIASIHRGVDVARAGGARHVVGSTGAQSEAAAKRFYALPDWVLLDMGDFAGGLLKYLRRHPLPKLTVAGGFGKLTKLSQGAMDLHSARSQVDFSALGRLAAEIRSDQRLGSAVADANTAMQALEIAGPELAQAVAARALAAIEKTLADAPVDAEVMIFDRSGALVARQSRVPFPESAVNG